MIELPIAANFVLVGPLTADIKAAGVNITGVSFNGGTKIATVYFPDGTSQGDQDTAEAVVDAHDPVVLTVKRIDGVVQVRPTKPRNLDSATEVTITVDGQSLPAASPLNANAILNVSDTITLAVETYPCEEVKA